MSNHSQPMTHNIKIASPHYKPLKDGLMDFLVQFDDRHFRAGDILILQEVSFNGKNVAGPTGRFITREVKHIVRKFKGLQGAYIILGLQVL